MNKFLLQIYFNRMFFRIIKILNFMFHSILNVLFYPNQQHLSVIIDFGDKLNS
jgi:hypothetical protein